MHRTGNILLWIWWACSQCDENRPSHLWKFSSPMNLNWKCNGSAFILPDICGAFDNCQRDGLGLSNRFHFWKHWHEKGSFSFIKSHWTIQNIKKMNQIFGSNKNFDRNFVIFPKFCILRKMWQLWIDKIITKCSSSNSTWLECISWKIWMIHSMQYVPVCIKYAAISYLILGVRLNMPSLAIGVDSKMFINYFKTMLNAC